jgi:hypothetical protein
LSSAKFWEVDRPGPNLVDQAVLPRRFRREDPVAIGIVPQCLDGLIRVLRKYLLEVGPDAHKFICLEDQVRDRPAPLARWLVQHDPRMTKSEAAPGLARGK